MRDIKLSETTWRFSIPRRILNTGQTFFSVGQMWHDEKLHISRLSSQLWTLEPQIWKFHKVQSVFQYYLIDKPQYQWTTFRILNPSCPHQITSCQKPIHLLSLIQLHWFTIMLNFSLFLRKEAFSVKINHQKNTWQFSNCHKNSFFLLSDKKRFPGNRKYFLHTKRKMSFIPQKKLCISK